MVWSEYTSGNVLGEKGVMGTHDMETYNFFKNSSNYGTPNRVYCALAPRELKKAKEFTDTLQNTFSSG